MVILVTRPERPARRTKERLEAAGYEVLVDPLLTLDFHPPERLLSGAPPDAVVITSSNGVRAIAGHSDLARLTALPLWTVGMRTTQAAREIGFSDIAGEALDLKTLTARLMARPRSRFLYIAATVRSGDLSELLPQHEIETAIVYTADPATALGAETVVALRDGRIETVLHYSRRLTETYLALSDIAGLPKQALIPRHLCLSENVAAPLRARAAATILIAGEPREDALLKLLPA